MSKVAYKLATDLETLGTLYADLQRAHDSALELLHKRGLELSTVQAINADLNSVVEGQQREINELRLAYARAEERITRLVVDLGVRA